ncbi:PTS glucitol transporter subunit IIA [Carnobacterium maltaromaticum]|uniref:PTS galactitol transporter subunit IIC n=1 Tax=Carnobacterium TaxID=2747 RepID=UPI0005515E6D|nr:MULTISPECIES: PTS transporter subunit IIC [Carnobacterium]MDT1946494.1 PTS glucitol transporter subunit IIA [Carnobacterium maltaromaticum]MDT2000861.1 PTS glucitol transporter subunit IIA [Carnobacterium maltaromaticum]NBL00257.1 PTS glucitol transporter subunit IIA [Erysipelotrichia bacterium]NCC82218.1 PTS glucitol transporter subunit IIA [Clostridia bacterium]
MDVIIKFANLIFQPLINLGSAPMMMILLTIFAMLMGVKFSKALEGGLKLAIALTGMGIVIGILTSAFSEALQAFVENTGIQLSVTDVGWAPLATITWGSPYTLFFLLVLVIINMVMLAINKTNTLDVDIFNFWHPALLGIIILYYSKNLFVATLFVVFIGVLKFINSDLMKPTFNDLLSMPDSNPTTTTHLNFMLNPVIMLFDTIFEKFFYKLDKYDFNAADLNKKIGFWGSKFAIGSYLGLFVGLLGQQSVSQIFSLAFTGAVSLELFSLIGSWFIAAVEPLSQGLTTFMAKRFPGRQFYIGIDWPFLGARAEMWAAANVLAPILLIMAMFLPGNSILPLAGIIAIGLTPALLVVCRGKMLRMITIGVFMLPIFLWSGTMIAPMITQTAQNVGAFPANLASTQLISHSTKEGPIESMLAVWIGKAISNPQVQTILLAVGALAVYSLLFVWYAHKMKQRNLAYKNAEEAAKVVVDSIDIA